MFRMYGRKVETLKYQVSYTESEEQRTDYAASEEEANEIAERVNGTVSALTDSGDAWMDGIEVADVPDTYGEAMRICQQGYDQWFANCKAEKIQKSKDDLESYLEAHPLLWTDGEYYSITEQKQNQLTATIVAAQVDGEPPEWNSTGGVCKVWDVSELGALGSTIKKRAKALVKYQQTKEIEMNNAETLEALNAIAVNYDTAM